MTSKFKSLLLGLFLLSSTGLFAQERQPSEIYSMMVFNFVKYIQWPEMDKPGEFVIGVIGNTEVYNSLNTLYGGKSKSAKTFVIKKFNSAADLSDCHVVFIDNSKSSEFEKVNAMVKGKSTLIITDHRGLGAKGSAINFKIVDDKLRFELNPQSISSANLKVSSALTSMAIII